MASLNEAFAFPLTNQVVSDKEVQKVNVFARGSYTALKTNTYKPMITKKTSELKIYNEKPLKE